MVLPGSLWLLFVCLLFWSCDARSLGNQIYNQNSSNYRFYVCLDKVSDLQMGTGQVTHCHSHLGSHWQSKSCKSKYLGFESWSALEGRKSCVLLSSQEELCTTGLYALFVKILAEVASACSSSVRPASPWRAGQHTQAFIPSHSYLTAVTTSECEAHWILHTYRTCFPVWRHSIKK